jgi:hypothetical protein
MSESNPRVAIQKHFGGGGVQRDTNPRKPARPKAKMMEDLQKVCPANRVKGFRDVKLDEEATSF